MQEANNGLKTTRGTDNVACRELAEADGIPLYILNEFEKSQKIV